MGLREEKKQATRAAIADTALQLFREKGFAATRIQDVTDRLRISEATFFNYFPTKESVLEAVADRLIEQTVTLLEDEAADADRSVCARISELAGVFADGLDGDPELIVLLAGNTRYFLGTRTERFDRALTLLARLFSEGQARGEVRDDIDASLLAELFLSASFGAIQTWVQAGGQGPLLRERLVTGARVLIDGCSPSFTRPRQPGG
jgi:AcrR family transcriptional regulator